MSITHATVATASAPTGGAEIGGNQWNAEHVIGADDNFVTDAEKTKLANLSGTNTGDQTVPVVATGAEVDTGTNDTKFMSPKAIEDSAYVKASYADGKVSDTVYGAGWNGDTSVAPSKNAVYDKVESLLVLSDGDKGDITVSASGATWTIDAGVVTEAKMVTADNVTNNVSNTKHGFVPKATDNALHVLLATGAWGAKYVHVSTSSGATTTGANTTPVDVSGAVFTYVANAVYKIWVMGRINATAATTGIGVHFNVSTAITDINAQTVHPLATSGTLSLGYSISDDASEGVSSGVPAGPLDVPFETVALFRPGNNTGTCQLRIRSETTAVTEVLAGCTMVVERLV